MTDPTPDPDRNPYREAIHHPDRTKQLRAFLVFTEDELDRVWRQVHALQHDDGSIPDEHLQQWSQRKGELDTLRLFHGMFAQALMAHTGTTDTVYGYADDSGPDDVSDDKPDGYSVE